MPATGYLQVHTYASYAQLPVENVAVTVTAADGTAIAIRVTDRSGKIQPISLPVPERSASQAPGNETPPYSTVVILARAEGFEHIRVEGVQVFADTLTVQDLELIPLSELPGAWDMEENFSTPPQNL